MLDYNSINTLFWLLVAVTVIFFLMKNDELLLIVVLFFYSAGLSRYDNVVNKGFKWVVVAYAKKIFSLNNQLGLEALNVFFLGTASFSLFYVLFRNFLSPLPRKQDSKGLFHQYLQSKTVTIFAAFLIFIPVSGLMKGVALGAGAASTGVGYFFLFGMALGGLITLMIMIFRSLTFSQNGSTKIIYGILIIFAAITSYDALIRFKFLSWAIAGGIVLLGGRSAFRKAPLILVGGIITALVFSFAAEKRNHGKAQGKDLTLSQQIDLATDRISSGEDANMLDGFMMVMQVYPYHLDYSYGMEHFEILLRPIPRAIWKDKPLGGYHNKLGLNENMRGGTVGISPSLYGSFYAEAGVVGVILLSILYAYLFVYIFRFAESYNSDMRYLIKGVTIASAIPLLRGGDLPGIIAFVGMTYWPVFLVIRGYNGFLKSEQGKQRAAQIEQERLRIQLAEQEAEMEMV